MAAMDGAGPRIIDIEKSIDLKNVRLMLDRGAVSMILPVHGQEEKVCGNYLQNVVCIESTRKLLRNENMFISIQLICEVFLLLSVKKWIS